MSAQSVATFHRPTIICALKSMQMHTSCSLIALPQNRSLNLMNFLVMPQLTKDWEIRARLQHFPSNNANFYFSSDATNWQQTIFLIVEIRAMNFLYKRLHSRIINNIFLSVFLSLRRRLEFRQEENKSCARCKTKCKVHTNGERNASTRLQPESTRQEIDKALRK